MELLRKLTSAFGPSGYEDKVAEIIIDEIKNSADEIRQDSMGNVIALKRGKGQGKIMLTAHMDQVGILVTAVEKNGLIRFINIGNYEPAEILYHRVAFGSSVSGVIAAEGDIKDLKFERLFIDIGAESRPDAEKKVNVGDLGVFKSDFSIDGTVIQSCALDDRVGCLVLIDVMKKIKEQKNSIYFVFTTQEESYASGASVAAYEVEPDMCISVDVSGEKNLKLGAGAAIKVMDSGIVYHHEVRELLKRAAEELKISCQVEVPGSHGSTESGKSDGYEVYISRAGVKTGVISIPIRYNHTPGEIADIRDIESAEELIIKAAGY